MSDSDSSFNSETSQILRIPSNRIGALIGIKGPNKERIEEATDTHIMIESETGEVEVKPNATLDDPVLLFKARDMVKAIGRGFTIEQAIKLAKDDFYFEVIALKEHVGDKPNHLYRIRSRLIGTKGRTRKSLEELTKA
ncbi:MAG: KH domain-containing protein, partial [Candidatus Kariarchaeaceae archaeon]